MCASHINWFSRRLREAVSCRSVFSPRSCCRPHGQPPTLPKKKATALGGQRGCDPRAGQTGALPSREADPTPPLGAPSTKPPKLAAKRAVQGNPCAEAGGLTTLPPLSLHRSQRGEGNPSCHIISILKPPPARQKALWGGPTSSSELSSTYSSWASRRSSSVRKGPASSFLGAPLT